MLLRLIAIMVIANLSSGCISTTTDETIKAMPEIAQTLTRYTREYVIFPGDILEVTIYRNENLSRAVQVRGDGRISLPLLDEIYVQHMTLSELDEYVTSRLSERLVDPEVTIIVQNPQEPMVYVFGEVSNAKPVPLRNARTAAQAVAQSGDMLISGKLDEVSVVRLDENGHLVAITIQENTSGQPGLYMALQNFPLQADDLVIVPESLRHQFVRRLNESVGAINQILTPYFQFRLLDEIVRRNDALTP